MGHSIEGLDAEGIVGVGLQLRDQDLAHGQAELAGGEVWAAPPAGATGPAAKAGPWTASAMHIVGDIPPAPIVQGRAPLQGHRRLIDGRDGIIWGRWGS